MDDDQIKIIACGLLVVAMTLLIAHNQYRIEQLEQTLLIHGIEFDPVLAAELDRMKR